MRIRRNDLLRLMAAIAFALAFSTGARADTSHDRTQVGHNITIGPDEQAGDVTCFGCSVHVRGHVSGDVTAFGGSVILEDQAEVSGDATVFGGNALLDKNAKLGGDLSVFGGRIRRAPDASVRGDVTNFSSPVWIVLIFLLPLLLFVGFVTFVIWLVVRLTWRAGLPQAA